MATQHALPDDELPPLVVTSFDAMNFMVIDGDVSALEVVQGLLKDISVQGIATARTAFTAVSHLADQKTKTDCIICDNRLVGISGLALLKRIRAGRNAVIPRDIRFILATDQPHQDLVEAAIRLDVNGFLTKPMTGSGILKSVQLAFSRSVRIKAVDAYSKIPLPC
jgi:DNA-binding NarL/FixJ family response regulator